MAGVLLISAIGGGGVAFMIRFFIALCKETKDRACHVVRLLPDSKWKIDPEELPSVEGSYDGRGVAEGQEQQVPTEHRYVFGR